MAEGGDSERLLLAPRTGGVGGGVGFSWLTGMGFVFLTFNSAMAIYRSSGVGHMDGARVAFVVVSYVDLLLLFFCLRRFERIERAPPGSASRWYLKVAVWVLTTALTLLFSHKVAAIMPEAVKVLVWLMASATVLGGFYAFVLQQPKDFALATLRSQHYLPETAGEGSSPHDHKPCDTASSSSRVRLIVDSGATSHAVGNILLLEGFQPYRPPLVAALADGSRLRVFGIGHIQMPNFIIPNVYLVEGVRDGLISTPQLDTHHGLISCFGNGVCRIMEADGTEVGGAILEQDGSYVLRFLEVPAGTGQV